MRSTVPVLSLCCSKCAGATATRRSLIALAAVAVVSLPGCGESREQLVEELVPDASVREMGLRTWAQIQTELPRSRRAGLQATLSEVTKKLLEARGEDPSDWEVVVFADPAINAFALPGNKIGVFEGMFEVIENDAQLAAVVSHEIGHLDAEHSQERIAAELGKELGLNAARLLLQANEVEYAGEIAAALGLGVQYGLVLPYSRAHELEADVLGVRLMARAGFEPAQSIALWRRIGAVAGDRSPAFLSTHPAPQDRIAALEQAIAQLP